MLMAYAVKGDNVGMECIQYTVRGIPKYLDAGIRRYATRESKSLNQALLDVLAAGLGYFRRPVKNESLLELAGTWVSDEKSEKAFAEMRVVDADLWQ